MCKTIEFEEQASITVLDERIVDSPVALGLDGCQVAKSERVRTHSWRMENDKRELHLAVLVNRQAVHCGLAG